MTNAVGWRARKGGTGARRERRRERNLPPEYDFSVAGIGISVIAVVVAVMFTV